MANTIQFKRGLNTNLPTLAAGEPGFSTDTKQLNIGDGTTNHEVVMHKIFDAQTILAATTDDTPAALTIPVQTVVGRITAGNVKALTVIEIQTLINVEDGADVTDAANVNTAGAVMETDFTAKGDLLTASATSTPVILAAGTNTYVLTANDAQAGGMEWAAAGAPGAHKDSHDPEDGADALDTAAAAEISAVVVAATGVSHSLARADHTHAINHAITDNHIVTIDGTVSATEIATFTVNGLDGTVVGIADNNIVAIDAADVTTTEYAKFTANGLESKTYAEVLADLSATAVAEFSMNSQKIVSLADPTAAQDAVTKAYADANIQGLKIHDSVVCATVANITLTAEQTLDGILTSTSRVLVVAQTTPEENGIYVTAAGAWSRATDLDAADEVAGSFAYITDGATLGSTGWACTVDPSGFVLDTTAMPWSQFSSAGYVTVSSGLTKTGNDIAPNENLEDLHTLGTVAADGEVIVGTGAGAFAYESGDTLRTSLGLAIGTDVLAFAAVIDGGTFV